MDRRRLRHRSVRPLDLHRPPLANHMKIRSNHPVTHHKTGADSAVTVRTVSLPQRHHRSPGRRRHSFHR